MYYMRLSDALSFTRNHWAWWESLMRMQEDRSLDLVGIMSGWRASLTKDSGVWNLECNGDGRGLAIRSN